MATSTKKAISIDQNVLLKIDQLVSKNLFKNRNRAIQISVEEKISRIDKSRLAVESAKLNIKEEQSLSEEGFKMDMTDFVIKDDNFIY